MLSRRSFLASLGAGALAAPSLVRLFAEDADDEFFTIAALPDTQFYSLKYPKIFLAQTRWLAENAERLRLVFVAHEGDVTDKNTPAEWEAADAAMKLLDGVVPYGILPGNHDMGEGGRAQERDTKRYNGAFGPSRFEKRPWYGGHFGDANDASFQLFEACGLRFLHVALEFGPRDDVLAWAAKVCEQHADRRAIVTTHAYGYWDDTRLGPGDRANPHGYGVNGNDGEDVWDKFVRKQKNIDLVLSGHIGADGVGRMASMADDGHFLHEVVANYQFLEEGGGGRLRLMKFVPAKNRVFVTTWSPHLAVFDEKNDNVFELDFDLGAKR